MAIFQYDQYYDAAMDMGQEMTKLLRHLTTQDHRDLPRSAETIIDHMTQLLGITSDVMKRQMVEITQLTHALVAEKMSSLNRERLLSMFKCGYTITD